MHFKVRDIANLVDYNLDTDFQKEKGFLSVALNTLLEDYLYYGFDESKKDTDN